jgi:hypothetical protein
MRTNIPLQEISLSTGIIFLEGVYSRGDVPSGMLLQADTKQRVEVKIHETRK